jgi:hypothetical protein
VARRIENTVRAAHADCRERTRPAGRFDRKTSATQPDGNSAKTLSKRVIDET